MNMRSVLLYVSNTKVSNSHRAFRRNEFIQNVPKTPLDLRGLYILVDFAHSSQSVFHSDLWAPPYLEIFGCGAAGEIDAFKESSEPQPL
jgi:hypothetical protein